jgi:hypothetical protein
MKPMKLKMPIQGKTLRQEYGKDFIWNFVLTGRFDGKLPDILKDKKPVSNFN